MRQPLLGGYVILAIRDGNGNRGGSDSGSGEAANISEAREVYYTKNGAKRR